MLHPDENNALNDNVSMELGMLHAVLNQVDYGLAVINADTRQLLFANTPAQSALHPASMQNTGLCLNDGRLHTRLPPHAAQLSQALARTKAGLRCLLSLVTGGSESTVAVMPLSAFAAPGDTATSSAPCYALLLFAKQQRCDTTSITLFARERGLTGAEVQVLAQVCRGMRPSEIATQHGVQVCTVRTQLRSIRQKTASDSVRELVEKVSVLPPLARQLSSVLTGINGSAMAFG